MRIEETEEFSVGFEIGWLYVDLFLGYYTLRIGRLPRVEFEEGDNFEDFLEDE